MYGVGPMGQCALRYAQRWAVFPCKPGSKKPNTEHGVKDATRDEDVITEWWRKEPRSNIGVATGVASGIIAVDLDGEEGPFNFAEMASHNGTQVPPALWQRTPSGGFHAVFEHPGGVLNNSAKKLADGIDTRGDGGYIVVAPSEIWDVGRYEWMARTDPPPVPGWLIRKLRTAHRRSRYAKLPTEQDVSEILERKARDLEEAREGERNETLNAVAYSMGRYVGAGLVSRTETWERLYVAGRRIGLTDGETNKTLHSGIMAGLANPREE